MRIGNKSGFTLLELLVVIALIGILVGILLPVLPQVRTPRRISANKVAMKAIVMSIERYREDFGNYPMSDSVACMPNKFGDGATSALNGSQNLAYYLTTRFTCGTVHYGPYMENLPQTRLIGNPPALVSPLGNHYYLYANVVDSDSASVGVKAAVRGYMIVDPGADGIFGGNIAPNANPPWTSDGTKNSDGNKCDLDNIINPRS